MHIRRGGGAGELSWWDDVGFVLNGRRVLVFWRHPRCVYRDAVEAQAMADVPEPSGPGFLDWRVFYDAVTEHQVELERVGIDLDVAPSMRVGWCSTATMVELVAPVEVCSEADVRALATFAKRLLKREVAVAEEWPGYRYGRQAWLAEAAKRDRARQSAA